MTSSKHEAIWLRNRTVKYDIYLVPESTSDAARDYLNRHTDGRSTYGEATIKSIISHVGDLPDPADRLAALKYAVGVAGTLENNVWSRPDPQYSGGISNVLRQYSAAVTRNNRDLIAAGEMKVAALMAMLPHIEEIPESLRAAELVYVLGSLHSAGAEYHGTVDKIASQLIDLSSRERSSRTRLDILHHVISFGKSELILVRAVAAYGRTMTGLAQVSRAKASDRISLLHLGRPIVRQAVNDHVRQLVA